VRLWAVTIVESVVLLIALAIAIASYRGGVPQRNAAGAYALSVEALREGQLGEADRHLKTLEAYCRRLEGPPPGNMHTGAELVPQIRFLRANLALRGGDVETAMELYEEVAEDERADEELAALALTAKAALVFKPFEKKDPETGARKALALLEKARRLDRDLPDALVAEAACLFWKKDYTEAAKRYEKIRAGTRAMSFEACKFFCVGEALSLAQDGDLDGARKALLRARFYDKDWDVPGDYSQFLKVQRLSRDERGDPARIGAREMLLSEVEQNWARYVIGDEATRYATLMAIGLAYTRGAREQRRRGNFAAERGKLKRALDTFQQATDLDKKNPAAFTSIAALRWDLVLNLRAHLAALEKQLAGAAARARTRLNREIAPLRRALPEAEIAYTAAHHTLVEMGALSEEAKVAGLKAIAGFRLARAEAGGWTEEGLADALAAIEAVLARSTDEADALRAKGVLLQKQGKLSEALVAWKKVLTLKDDPPLKGLVGVYESRAQIVAWRPTRPPGTKGATGAPFLVRDRAPLVGFLFKPARAGETVKSEDVLLYLDGTEVPAVLSGTEVLYLVPPTEPLSDGRHVVRGMLKGRLGTAVDLSFEFLVDNSPPEVDSVSPDVHERPRPGKPRIKIKYHDALAGVDPSSVRLDLRSVPPTMPALSVTLIEGGRYTFNDPENGIVKDTPAATAKFLMVVPSRNLGPGSYELRLEVSDARGLKKRKSWVITVGR